jgi:hypothetical protein
VTASPVMPGGSLWRGSVLRHGFVDAEFAHDGAPWCFGLQLLGVLPQGFG